MTDIKEHNWIHIYSGNNSISKEEWQPIQNLPYQNKPVGGLWLSKYNGEDYNICEWLDFIQDEIAENGEYSTLYRMASNYMGGFLVKLKENSNVLIIENEEELEQIKSKYLLCKSLNYEKIAETFDALYINLFALPSKYWSKYQDNYFNFKTWGCSTLLIFNFESIESFEPIEIETVIESNGSIYYKLKEEKKYRKEYHERKKEN